MQRTVLWVWQVAAVRPGTTTCTARALLLYISLTMNSEPPAAAGAAGGAPHASLPPSDASPGGIPHPVPPGLRLPGRLWLIILAGCIVAGVLDSSQTALRGMLLGTGRVDWAEVVFQAAEWLILAGLTPLVFLLGQQFPLRRPILTRALVVHAGGALLLCICWASLGVVVRRELGRGWTESFWEELAGWTLFSLPWSFFMYFALLGTVHAFSYYLEARDRQLQTVQLTGQLAESRLRALQSQLRPHFLFNTLNAVTVLVRDGRGPLAVRMLDRLSELLRQLLRSDQAHEIALVAELHLVRQYLAIEEVRFSDRLHVDFRVEEEVLGAAVPAFVLQPLVENALRHGLGGEDEVVQIEIGARRQGERLELWVRDNGPGVQPAAAPGMGLDNTRERLSTLYGDAARLTLSDRTGGGAIAQVVLPLRPVAAGQSGPVRGD